jgi:hypothetical protein
VVGQLLPSAHILLKNSALHYSVKLKPRNHNILLAGIPTTFKEVLHDKIQQVDGITRTKTMLSLEESRKEPQSPVN